MRCADLRCNQTALELHLTSDPLGGRLELGKGNSNFFGAPLANESALLLLLL